MARGPRRPRDVPELHSPMEAPIHPYSSVFSVAKIARSAASTPGYCDPQQRVFTLRAHAFLS